MFVWVSKILQYDRIDVSWGIDINKTSASKVCTILHDWYFKDIGYEFESYVCSGCHHILMMFYELKNFAILKVLITDVFYRMWLKMMQLICWVILN